MNSSNLKLIIEKHKKKLENIFIDIIFKNKNELFLEYLKNTDRLN